MSDNYVLPKIIFDYGFFNNIPLINEKKICTYGTRDG